MLKLTINGGRMAELHLIREGLTQCRYRTSLISKFGWKDALCAWKEDGYEGAFKREYSISKAGCTLYDVISTIPDWVPSKI